MLNNFRNMKKLGNASSAKHYSRKTTNLKNLDHIQNMKNKHVRKVTESAFHNRTGNTIQLSWPSLLLNKRGLAAVMVPDKPCFSPLYCNEIKDFILSSNGIYKLTPYNRWCEVRNMENIVCNALIVIEGLDISQYADVNEPHASSVIKNILNLEKENHFRKFFPFCDAKVHFTHNRSEINFAEDIYNCFLPGDVKDYINGLAAMSTKSIRPSGKLRRDLENIMNSKDQFDRRKLLVSLEDMESCGFFQPSHAKLDIKYSRSHYKEVTPNSPMFAVDCEMVITLDSFLKHEVSLAKISIVNENLELVYSSFAKPTNIITNYVTNVNGITEKDLENVTTRLEDVQRDLAELLPADVILVGHGLNSDLSALKLCHPYCIDTSRIYNVKGFRTTIGLKDAAKIFLKSVRCSKIAHDPTEDACLSMLLTKLKLSKYQYFGDMMNGWNNILDPVNEANIFPCRTNIFELFSNSSIHPSVVCSPALKVELSTNSNKYANFVEASSNKLALHKAIELVSKSRCVFAHLQEEGGRKLNTNEVDEHLCQLYKALPAGSLLTVLLPNLSTDSALSNGCALIALK